MSENLNPEIPVISEELENKADTPAGQPAVEPVEQPTVETVEETVEPVEQPVEQEKTLFELVEELKSFMEDDQRMTKAKEAEAIKSAFYKKLSKDRSSDSADVDPENNPFAAVEEAFKDLFAKFKEEKAEYNRQQERDRAANLVAKQAVVDDLKALVSGADENMNLSFNQFRDIQNRWREIGPVPMQNFRDLNDTYQFYVEKFYDMVKINRDLRDLDFRKNLEAKEAFCEAAEKLAESDNIVESFRELQKLHEQWKEYGPVAKEFRESIWDRFKAATAVINKRYQAYFEEQKSRQGENLEAKSALCDRVEELAGMEITSSKDWNAYTKEIGDIQAQWKKIGFASKKDNQKIYDRFRAACDHFFEKKRVFYSQFRDDMNENVAKKMAIIEEVEALKTSTDWKKTTDRIIALQKEWKQIGAVPRKKSDQLWKRFRGACDAFFAERDKNARPENDFYGNLKAKRKLVEDVKGFDVPQDAADAQAAYADFVDKWQAIGHVPFKDKDALNKSWKDVLHEKFPDMSSAGARAPRSGKEALIQKYNALQQDLDTYENNIGFFSMTKNSEPLIKQMQAKIDSTRKELEELKTRIREYEEGEQ
ncbi:MAG: DUF349 domain-containing protein [Bacteroidales bacterium]|nr:DUF349 domain-containing protein [Bacteroidales bacterium]